MSESLIIDGRLARLELKELTDAWAAAVNFGGIEEIGIQISIAKHRSTTHETAQKSHTYRKGFADVTMSITGFHEDGDPGQLLVWTNALVEARLDFRFFMEKDPGSSKLLFEGECFMEDGNPSGPLEGNAPLSMTLCGSGVEIKDQSLVT